MKADFILDSAKNDLIKLETAYNQIDPLQKCYAMYCVTQANAVSWANQLIPYQSADVLGLGIIKH